MIVFIKKKEIIMTTKLSLDPTQYTPDSFFESPKTDDSKQGAESKVREIFLQNTSYQSKNLCFVDLSAIPSFSEKGILKEVKKYLPFFIEDQKGNDCIRLKVSNKYVSILKYALQSGFVFQEANAEFSILNKNYGTVLSEFLKGTCKNPALQIGEYNPKKQTGAEIAIKDSEDDPKVPHAKRLDIRFLEGIRDDVQYRLQVQGLNPGRSVDELFSSKTWDIEFYNKLNFPVNLGTLEDQPMFSTKKDEIGLRFLDMPIYIPNQGWKIPKELEQFKEVIAKAAAFERSVNPDFEKYNYVYITVDQGEVEPHKAQRRTGWHGDSYLRIDSKKRDVDVPCDHVYVVADSCPTPFLPGPFSLEGIDPENIDEVLQRFSSVAEGKIPTYYPNNTLLRLDPYCVHNVGFNNTDQTLFRTFVKISVSRSKYCKLGNAHNPLFIYDWSMVPRHGVPYTKEALQKSSHRKDRDQFKEIIPSIIDFSKSTCKLEWAKSEIQTAVRTKEIFAEPAREREVLRSINDGFLITILSAEKGDWKVSASHGDQYFLSRAKMEKFYDKDPIREGVFIPKPVMRRFVELKENVRFKASWDTVQYASKGDILMSAGKDEIYAIPRDFFYDEFTIKNM